MGGSGSRRSSFPGAVGKTIGLVELFAAARDRGLLGLALSRASWFDATTNSVRTLEVPVVGGRTVWEAVEDPLHWLFVAEEPNYFGRLETEPPRGVDQIRIPHPTVADHSAHDVQSARNLAGRLRQMSGVKLPHGQPESSVFVASLPGSAEEAARLLLDGGFAGTAALGRKFPEFPGGLHVQVAWPQQENSRFCDIVRSVV